MHLLITSLLPSFFPLFGLFLFFGKCELPCQLFVTVCTHHHHNGALILWQHCKVSSHSRCGMTLMEFFVLVMDECLHGAVTGGWPPATQPLLQSQCPVQQNQGIFLFPPPPSSLFSLLPHFAHNPPMIRSAGWLYLTATPVNKYTPPKFTNWKREFVAGYQTSAQYKTSQNDCKTVLKRFRIAKSSVPNFCRKPFLRS